MASKYTFTYEFLPDQWSGEFPKTTSVLVVENVESLPAVLASFKDFLASTGFQFNPEDNLDVVNLGQVEQNQNVPEQTQENVQVPEGILGPEDC